VKTLSPFNARVRSQVRTNKERERKWEGHNKTEKKEEREMKREVDIPAVMEYSEDGTLVGEREKFQTTIAIHCAWCGLFLGEKEGNGVEGVSHGICDKCRKELREG